MPTKSKICEAYNDPNADNLLVSNEDRKFRVHLYILKAHR